MQNNTTRKTQWDGRRAMFWIAPLLVVLTFVILDAGAVAWSASLLDGRQLTAEIFTFFVVLMGVAVTVWKLRVG